MKIVSKRMVAALLAVLMLAGMLVGCDKEEPVDDLPEETSPIAAGTAADDPAEVISMQSEHYTVTNDMFAYYFYKDFYDAIDVYYESYYYFQNLDPTIDLKEQTYGESNTWFDYFISLTVQNVSNYLIYAEQALKEGVSLDEADKKIIEDDIAALEQAAAAEGKSTQEFLDFRFGKGLTLDTVRRCQELYLLGTKLYDRDLAAFDYDKKDYEQYFEENKDQFLYIDYREVVVRASYPDDATPDEIALAYSEAKKQADVIAASKNLTEYVERGVAYYESINDTLDEPLTEDQIFTKVTNIVAQYSYRDTTSLGKWAFAEGRKSGDIVMLDNGAGIYTVFYLQSAPYRADNATKNLRIAGFSLSEHEGDLEKAKAAANDLVAKHEALGRTGEGFKQACEELSIIGGSLRKEMDLGQLEPIIENWVFNSSRKAGDCAVLEDEETVYVVYFEGDGGISWELQAHESLLSRDLNELFSKYVEEHEPVYSIENMYLLSGKTAYTGMEKTDE